MACVSRMLGGAFMHPRINTWIKTIILYTVSTYYDKSTVKNTCCTHIARGVGSKFATCLAAALQSARVIIYHTICFNEI